MQMKFLLSVATAALLAGTGLANAQAGMNREAPSGVTQQQSNPPQSGPAANPMQRDDAAGSRGPGKTTRSKPGMQKGDRAQDDMPQQKMHQKKSAQDNVKGEQPRRSSETGGKSDKGMTAQERNGADSKNARDGRSQTTGQAGAGAKLSAEQRTKITTVIKEQQVQPIANVNFAISVGKRVPKTVHFHPLPTEIITIYPDWRGYQFFLVRNEIIVVNPRTLEIVAVLEA